MHPEKMRKNKFAFWLTLIFLLTLSPFRLDRVCLYAADSADFQAIEIKSITTLDPYLQILNYKAHNGLLQDPNKTLVRILVKTESGKKDCTALPVITKAGGILTSYCSVAQLDNLSQIAGIVKIEIGSRCMLLQSKDIELSPVSSDQVNPVTISQEPSGKEVVIGLIGSGIALGNTDFFNPESKESKVIYVWDQKNQSGNSPSLYGQSYGSEYDSEGVINAINTGALVGKDLNAHTTGIASLCAGQWGLAPNANIIFVKSSSAKAEIVEAVYYIFRKAEQLHKPCVVNLSHGMDFGRHDGTSLFEQALEALVGKGRIIVCSAGNTKPQSTFAGQSDSNEIRIPVQIGPFENKDKKKRRLISSVLTLCGNFNELEIYTETDSKKAAVIREGYTGQVTLSKDTTIFFAWDSKNHDHDLNYLILQWYSKPTKENQRWTLLARTVNEKHVSRACLAKAWISEGSPLIKFRDNGNLGHYEVQIPATAKNIIAVGSSNKAGIPSKFSPLPMYLNGEYKPDCYAPGENVIVSVPYNMKHSTKRRTTKMTGSSFSAPQVTGCIALILQFQPDLGPPEIKSVLRQCSDYLTPPEQRVPFVAPDRFRQKLLESMKSRK